MLGSKERALVWVGILCNEGLLNDSEVEDLRFQINSSDLAETCPSWADFFSTGCGDPECPNIHGYKLVTSDGDEFNIPPTTSKTQAQSVVNSCIKAGYIAQKDGDRLNRLIFDSRLSEISIQTPNGIGAEEFARLLQEELMRRMGNLEG